jgi:Zn-dependent protease with chaperone function
VETTGPSLRSRIVLAIVLTVAFYALALALLAALVVGAFVHIGMLTLACGLAAVALLRGIVPRRRRYEPPGPALTREEQPELHALLDDVAARAGDRPVDDVYLAHDVNAGVLEIPDGFPRRRRRVLELGLPLLQVVDREALAAIVAHEHGHYVGGDTRYALWIGRTRVAIDRTIHHMGNSDRIIQSIVAYPFRWYGALFVRITAAVSRRQERAADAVAVRTAGAQAHARALVAINRAGLAFDTYLSQEVEPALAGDVHPPIAAGFGRMLAVPHVRDGVDALIRRRIAEETLDRRDTHPTLAERLGALGVDDPADVAPAPDGTPMAITLLRDVPALERGLLREPERLRAVAWEEVGRSATAEHAREYVARHAELLAGRTVADAGAMAKDPRETYDRAFSDDPPVGPEEREAATEFVIHLLTYAVLNAATDAGWTIMSLPGEPHTATLEAGRFPPAPLLWQVQRGELDPAAWREAVTELDLADRPLVPPDLDLDHDDRPSAEDRSLAETAR